jgi:hypothetical protein
MDRLPLIRATTLVFIGNIPTVYPSHSLSEIPNPYKQKCQNCENLNQSRKFLTLVSKSAKIAKIILQCIANETAVATFSKIGLATFSQLLVTKSTAMSHICHTLITSIQGEPCCSCSITSRCLTIHSLTFCHPSALVMSSRIHFGKSGIESTPMAVPSLPQSDQVCIGL